MGNSEVAFILHQTLQHFSVFTLTKKDSHYSELSLTIRFDQHLLLTHVLYVDGAVDDVLRRGAVIVLHLLTLVTLDLKGISCTVEEEQNGKMYTFVAGFIEDCVFPYGID